MKIQLDSFDFIEIIDYTPSLPTLEKTTMANITVRNLDGKIKQRLRVRSAENGHSMEGGWDFSRRVMSESRQPHNLAASIRSHIDSAERFDLDLPARETMTEPPHLDQIP